jgi:hypothetical protein
MSGNTILGPREDSDPAIDGAARSAAGGRVVRYWTWVGDHRGQCRTAGGPHCDAPGHGGRLLHARHRIPAAGLEPHQRRDLHAESVAGRTVPVRWHLSLPRRDCLHGRVRRSGLPALEASIGHIRERPQGPCFLGHHTGDPQLCLPDSTGVLPPMPTSASSATTSAGSWSWPCTCGTGCAD